MGAAQATATSPCHFLARLFPLAGMYFSSEASLFCSLCVRQSSGLEPLAMQSQVCAHLWFFWLVATKRRCNKILISNNNIMIATITTINVSSTRRCLIYSLNSGSGAGPCPPGAKRDVFQGVVARWARRRLLRRSYGCQALGEVGACEDLSGTGQYGNALYFGLRLFFLFFSTSPLPR